MNKRYNFSTGESFEADAADLLAAYKQNALYIQNYQEVFENLDDASYVARGNGFCDSKYSEDFIEAQLAKYQQRQRELEGWMRAAVATKPVLRSMIRAMKKARTSDELVAQSAVIMKKLENHPAFRKAQRVMLYSSLPDEVATTSFLEKWRHKKQIILPTVVGDDIIPVALDDDTQFAVGDFDIMEPQSHPYAGGYDLIVVPGMAFDDAGNRLGRGKGYYDRFLCQHVDIEKIGICFGFQRVACVPTEPTDIRMDEVMSAVER